MGLFGLFDKKTCAICRGEIGMLGNRKLEDGNLCKSCASQLSPWFSDRRHSTVNEIAAQLQYRAANLERLRGFRPTRVFGWGWQKLYIDDSMGCFTICGENDLTRGNPDLVDPGMIVACVPDVDDIRWEVYRKGPDGRDIRFDPPRYRYEYHFRLKLQISSPWFDDVTFDVNGTSIREEEWDRCQAALRQLEDAMEALTGVRQDLSGYIRYPQPFCMNCGSFLDANGRCPHCDPSLLDGVLGAVGAIMGAAAGSQRPAPPVAPPPQPGVGRVAPPQPQGRPMPPQAPQGRPTPGPQPRPAAPQAPQGRPAPTAQPQARPTAPQGRPAPTAQPQARPAAPQGRPTPTAQPQARPAAPQAPQGRPAAGAQPQNGAGRPLSGGGRNAAPQNGGKGTPGPRGPQGPRR